MPIRLRLGNNWGGFRQIGQRTSKRQHWFCAYVLIGAFSLAIMISTAASAQEVEAPSNTQPAVDGANGELLFGGLFGDGDAYGATGSFAVPLGHQYGLQLDGVAVKLDSSNSDNVDILETGFHFFWRDPSKDLLGIVAGYVNLGNGLNADFYQGGVEGALYLGRMPIASIAGVTGGDVIDNDFFVRTMVSHYPTDDISLQLGYAYQNENGSLLYGGAFAFNTQSGIAPSLYLSEKLREGGDNFVETGR